MSDLALLFLGGIFGLVFGVLATIWVIGYATNKANKGFATWWNKRES